MKHRTWLGAIALILLGAAAGLWGPDAFRKSDAIASVGAAALESVASAGAREANASNAAAAPLILSYSAKFVCQEPLQPGALYYGTVAPLVQEKTEVLIHNPQPNSITFYRKAVRARLESAAEIAPGNWAAVTLKPDQAIRLDCDDVAKLLTGNPAATFIGTYGIGVKVEGFLVIGVGPQTVSGRTTVASLDVTAEYSRGSEVLKKDINYQPWWWYWWWPLPWRLGYAYQRILAISDTTLNIDCRSALYNALHQDVTRNITDQTQASHTNAALSEGAKYDPTNVLNLAGDTQPALVALIGRCDKIDTFNMSVDYVLVSNKTSTDPDPRGGGTRIAYPWHPGRLYDLTVVMPQNVTKDLDAYLRQWHTQRWIDAGTNSATVQTAMNYFIPYWCGWGYWWWWWHNGDCTDIGVGEGESLDVEQIVPTRVFMSVWPPAGAGAIKR